MSLIQIDNILTTVNYQPIIKNDNFGIIDFESIEILYDIQQLLNKHEFYVGLLGKNIDENIKYLYDSTGIFKELNITKEDLDRSLEGVYDITYESLIEKIKDTAKRIIQKIIDLINVTIKRIRDVVKRIYEFIFPSKNNQSDITKAANIVEQIQQSNGSIKIKGFELNKLYRRIEFYNSIITFYDRVTPSNINNNSGIARLFNISELEQIVSSFRWNDLQARISNLRIAIEQQFKKFGDVVKFNIRDFRIQIENLKSKEIVIDKNNTNISKSCIENISTNYEAIVPRLESIVKSLENMNENFSNSRTLTTANHTYLTVYFNLMTMLIRNITLISVAAANDAQRFKITCDNIIKSKIER